MCPSSPPSLAPTQRYKVIDTHRVTPWILGTSPGSSMAYETPLKVVPTSRARTRERVLPVYGLRVPEAGFMRREEWEWEWAGSGEQEGGRAGS